jgi:hypothetical protein
MERGAALFAVQALAGREKGIKKFIREEAHRAIVRFCEE